MSLVDAALSFVGGGGLTSAVGTIVGGVAKYKERKLEMAHELAMQPAEEFRMKYELGMLRRQIEHDRFLTEQNLMIQVERSAGETQLAAINADASDTAAALGMQGMPWQVGAIKTLFRPFLTLVLWVAVVVILIVGPANDSELMVITVTTINNGAGMSLGLWFGSRMMASRNNGS